MALIVALSPMPAAQAQTARPSPAAPPPSAGPAIAAPSSSASAEPAPTTPATSAEPGAPAGTAPSPVPSAAPASRAHLHRPGTDVDGDVFSGSLESQIYVIKGNVTLHSDPKIDRAFADATESDEPLTVTADEIDIDKLEMSYVAKGHVRFKQGTRSGQADLAMLSEQTRNLDLVGNADVLDGDHRARAAKMHYNLADRRFHGSGDVRIYEPAPTPAPRAPSAPPKRKRRLPF